MPQLNLPKKIVCSAHLWISIFLVILALIFCLTPIASFDTSGDKGYQIVSFVRENLNFDAGYVEFDDTVEVSSLGVLNSIGFTVDFIKASADDDYFTKAELQAYIQTEEGREKFQLVATILYYSMNEFVTNGMSGTVLELTCKSLVSSMTATMISVIGGIMLLLVLTILTIAALIRGLNNITSPEKASTKVGASLSRVLVTLLTFALFQRAAPGLSTTGSGFDAMVALACVSLGISLIVTRLRAYPKGKFKYINIVQGTSLLSLIGFIVYLTNLFDVGIASTFANSSLMSYASYEENYAVFVIMGLYIVLAVSSISYLDRIVRRLICAVDGKNKDNNIGYAILCLVVYILPAVVMGMDYLVLHPDSEGAFAGMLAGSIIMIISEIAAIALRNNLCKGLSKECMNEVIKGIIIDYKKPAAKAAKEDAKEATAIEEAPIVEDAPIVEEVTADAE